MRRRAGATVLVVVALTMTGCATPEGLAAFSRPVEVVWEASADIVGRVAVGEHIAAAYTRQGEDISLTAWGLGDGRKLWSQRVSLGADAPGYTIGAALVTLDGRDYTAALEPDGTRVTVREGDTISSVGGIEWANRPRACADDDGFCFSGRPAGAEGFTLLRLDPDDDGIVPDTTDLAPEDARLLGEHVFATDGRTDDDPERLGMVSDVGEVVWERAYRDVFGEWATSDNGWDWDESDDIVVGEGAGFAPGVRDAVEQGGRVPVDLVAARRVVGLDADTGETRWTVPGGMTCPVAGDRAAYDDVMVLCRVDGGEVVVDVADGVTTEDWSGVDLRLVGVELSSGEESWSIPLPGSVMESERGDSGFVPGAGVIVVEREGRASFIDPADGSEQDTGDAILACARPRPALLTETNQDGDRFERQVGDDAFPCDAYGAEVDAFSAGAAEAAGIEAGDGVWIVATTNGLAAVHG